MPSTPLGQILKEEGRKQRWLAEQVGVDESLVSRWVHGLRVPDDMRAAIADALGRERDELFPEEQVPA